MNRPAEAQGGRGGAKQEPGPACPGWPGQVNTGRDRKQRGSIFRPCRTAFKWIWINWQGFDYRLRSQIEGKHEEIYINKRG